MDSSPGLIDALRKTGFIEYLYTCECGDHGMLWLRSDMHTLQCRCGRPLLLMGPIEVTTLL